MSEISNIDAIINLVFKEARAREKHNINHQVYLVLAEVTDKVSSIVIEHVYQERRKREGAEKNP
ncbi:hypothetical protein ES702_06772 [subsurface metagenome]